MTDTPMWVLRDDGSPIPAQGGDSMPPVTIVFCEPHALEATNRALVTSGYPPENTMAEAAVVCQAMMAMKGDPQASSLITQSETGGVCEWCEAIIEEKRSRVDPEIAAVYDVPADQLHTIDPEALDLVIRAEGDEKETA